LDSALSVFDPLERDEVTRAQFVAMCGHQVDLVLGIAIPDISVRGVPTADQVDVKHLAYAACRFALNAE
jgi:hypothetical protein